MEDINFLLGAMFGAIVTIVTYGIYTENHKEK